MRNKANEKQLRAAVHIAARIMAREAICIGIPAHDCANQSVDACTECNEQWLFKKGQQAVREKSSTAPSSWISVDDRLPEKEYSTVLGIVNGQCNGVTYRNAIELVTYFGDEREYIGVGKWMLDKQPYAKITVSHWQPLPALPKEVQHGINDQA